MSFSDQLLAMCKNHRESGIEKAARDFATAIESRIESSGQNPLPFMAAYHAKILDLAKRCIDQANIETEDAGARLAEHKRKIAELEAEVAAQARINELQAQLSKPEESAEPTPAQE